MNYYLDIETTGINELVDKIITIQYMALDENSGNPAGQLKILKEWEFDEKTILKKFIEVFVPEKEWAFVPVGYNLNFEHKFFLQRCKANELKPIDILNRPFLDLKAIGVLMNNGSFTGSGLDKLTNKKSDGRVIPGWYKEKKYEEIESYIKNETQAYTEFCAFCYAEMPQLLDKFRKQLN